MKRLRAYQESAITSAVDVLSEHAAAQLHMACGTGKTLVSLHIAQRHAPGNSLIVVLVPSIALTEQIMREWRTNSAELFSALAVCSDDTVTDAPVHAIDLSVHVTTSPAEVREWITNTSGRRCIFGTYASAHVVAEALRTSGLEADLVVCDEAHHLTGLRASSTRRILEPGFLPSRKRLFATATPRFDQRLTGEIEIAGMDDEDTFGPVAAQYRFAQAITDGYLKDYRLAVIGVTEAEARAVLTDHSVEYVEGLGSASIHSLATQVALIKAQGLYEFRRVLTFHHRVADAIDFALQVPATSQRLGEPGNMVARHVHGEMDMTQRGRILQHLRHPPDKGWSVVSNVRCLSEGVDIPAVDAVLFASRKKSAVDIVQAVGRAIRRDPESAQVATIILPIIVDSADNGDVSSVNPGAYSELWRVISALKSHDEELAASFNTARSVVRTERDVVLPEKISVVMPPGTSDHILSQLSVMLIKNTTSSWWEGFGAAARFYAQHGHLIVPRSFVESGTGIHLGRWINSQRSRAKTTYMSTERRRLLESISMVWDFQRPILTWEQAFDKAKEFFQEHRHLRVRATYKNDEGYALGDWIQIQRMRNRRGELTEEQIALCDSVGMIWDGSVDSWTEGFAAAEAHWSTHGHLQVISSYVDPIGFRLGQWLSRQRQKRSGTHGKTLTADQISQLDRIGMVWSARDDLWSTGYNAATMFYRTHGHLAAPRRYVDPDTGFLTGSWLMARRVQKNKGKLSREKIVALEAIGMVWAR